MGIPSRRKQKKITRFFTRYLYVKYEKQNTIIYNKKKKNQQFFLNLMILQHSVFTPNVTTFDALILQ